MEDIGYDFISLNKIKVQKYNARNRNIQDGIEDLEESIKANGLIDAIVVYPNSDSGNYLLIIGQRRYNAYHRLNKTYPESGYDKIKCRIIKEPESEEKISLSLAENITQLPVNNSDLIRATTNLYDKYGEYEIVQKKFGITEKMVKAYVRFSRLPEKIKDAVKDNSISTNPENALRSALKAIDACQFDEYDDVSEEHVLEIAKAIASSEFNSNIIVVEAAKGGTASEIINRSRAKKVFKQSIDLDIFLSEKLDKIAKVDNQNARERATDYVVKGINEDFAQLSDEQ